MKRKILLASSFVFFVISFFIISHYKISLNDIITLPLNLISATSSATVSINVVPVISFVILQIAGLMLIGIFSLKEVSKRRDVISVSTGGAAVIIGLFFAPINFIYLFYSIGFIVSCYLVSKYFPRFYEEFKVWRYYRAGVTTTKLAFLVTSIFIAGGIYVEIHSDKMIQEEFYNSTIDALRGSIKFDSDGSDIPGYENLTAAQKAQVDKRIQEQNAESKEQIDTLLRSQINTSPVLSLYMKNLAVISALTIFSGLLFLRGIMSPVGGLVSFVLLFIFQKRKKHHPANPTLSRNP